MDTKTLAYLTNKELTNQLTLRDDLTDLEHELIDRLILATDEVERLVEDPPSYECTTCGEAIVG